MKETTLTQLAKWIDQWQGPLYRYAFMRVGNRAEAEDVVQEAFIKLYTSPQDVTNPKAWLFRTVANGCIDLLRKRKKIEELSERMPAPSAEADSEAAEEQRRVEELLGRLTEAQREVIMLHIHAGLRFTEIATILDKPTTTIKSRYKSGIEALRKEYFNNH